MDRIKIIKGDITKIEVDAIVNAANTSLLGGGGVDGAIHRAGGIKILEGCKKIIAEQGGCEVGEAVVTTAGQLPAKFVIHTVGPIWYGGNDDEKVKLKNCYTNSLLRAKEFNCKSIAFPNISTGIYCFPKDLAAKISVETIKNHLKEDTEIEVILVCYDDENYQILKKEMEN